MEFWHYFLLAFKRIEKFQLFKLFVINSPALLSVLWYIMKFIADKKTQSRIQILDDPSELLRLLNPQVNIFVELNI